MKKGIEDDLPTSPNFDLILWSKSLDRGLDVRFQGEYLGPISHTLIASCQADECSYANEGLNRGLFTQAFLRLVADHASDSLTCTDLVGSLPNLYW
jgi:hypothetical protein